MDWNIWDTFFLISMCVLACSVLAAAGFALWKQLRQVRLDRVLKPFYLFFGLFFAGSWVLLFLPTAADAGLYSGEAGLLLREGNGFWNVLRLILLAFHNTLQMFTVDADKVLIRDFVLCGEGLKEAYRVCLSVLYAVSPLLTMTFLVSFFSDFLSYMRYFFRFFCPVY
ncbi:MAG: hypothetical protein ILO68_06825, partial [Clostridia bacterium]|nr:hypothetical protein [Clostridia bacterium]